MPMIERYAKAAFTFFNEKVENILATITLLAENAEKEAWLASQIGMRQNSGEILFLTTYRTRATKADHPCFGKL